MALATEDEWASDPQLREMRREFVASFSGRKQAILGFAPALAQGQAGEVSYEDALRGVTGLAHKIAGAAETYGFPTLTRAGAALEDWYHQTAPGKRTPVEVQLRIEFLCEALTQCQALGKDARELASDPRFTSFFK